MDNKKFGGKSYDITEIEFPLHFVFEYLINSLCHGAMNWNDSGVENSINTALNELVEFPNTIDEWLQSANYNLQKLYFIAKCTCVFFFPAKVTAVLFVASLSCFDQGLYEGEHINAMHEAIQLFDEIINSRWFRGTSMILFLNKSGLLKRKIEEKDLRICFGEYDGDNSYTDAI